MYDIISIGSSIIDSFIISKAFQVKKSEQGKLLCQMYGEKIDVDEYIVVTGGGGSNTAVGFARMGFRTGIVTELGKDVFAQFIIDELRKEIVSTNMIVTEKHEKTGGSIILLGEDGSRTIMVHRGASAQLDPKDIPKQRIEQSKWVHLSSIAGQLEALQTIFKAVKNSETHLSWNPGNVELELLQSGKLDPKELKVDILFVNEHEWQMIESQRAQLLEIIPQIVITHGKRGGEVYLDGKPHTKFMAKETKIVDETGAGDSFIVGYVTGQIKKKSIIESCNWGKRNAESVISKIGAKPGLLTITQLESHNSIHD